MDFISGSARVFPSETACRTSNTAYSITLLPAVLAVISRPSRIGTPLLMSVLSVRVNLATATFRRIIPKIGSLRKILSVIARPFSTFLIWAKAMTKATKAMAVSRPPMPARKWLKLMISSVGNGSVPPMEENILENVGTTKIMIMAMTKTAIPVTTMG